MNKKRISVLRVIWLFWIIIMYFFLLQPGDESAQLSSCITQFILHTLKFRDVDPVLLEHILRKCTHFSAFAISGILGTIVLSSSCSRPRVCLTLLIHVSLAALSEILQLLSPGRRFTPADIMIDCSGALLGIVSSIVLIHLCAIRKCIQSKKEENKNGSYT